jgi:ribosomal protein L14E/L6E/L27E
VDQPGLRPGAIVRSLAGRDQGCRYVVLRQVDERFVTVANGRGRPVDRPKRKNRRHLEVLGWANATLALRLERGDKVTDLDIVNTLDPDPSRVLEEV